MTEEEKILKVTEAAEVCFQVVGASFMGAAYMSKDIKKAVQRQVGSDNFDQLLQWSHGFVKLNAEVPSGRPQQCLREGVVKFLSCLYSPPEQTGCKRVGRENFSKTATTLGICHRVAGDVQEMIA